VYILVICSYIAERVNFSSAPVALPSVSRCRFFSEGGNAIIAYCIVAQIVVLTTYWFLKTTTSKRFFVCVCSH
jgi:hypothetical protein